MSGRLPISTSAAAGAAAARPPPPAASPPPPPHAHVYALDAPGVQLAHEEVSFATYDDATCQLLVVKGRHVFAYDTTAASHHSLRWMYPLQEGPPVAAMRASLDNRLLALQRSAALLELVDLASGNCFVYGIHRGRGAVLGFFFSDAPGCDMVVVTTRALEMCQFAAGRQGLRLRERVRHSSAWCIASHDTRMLLLGSAQQGSGTGPLSAWQFTAAGVLQLPPFELPGPLPATSAVRDLLPASAPAPDAFGAAGAADPPPETAAPAAGMAAAAAAGALVSPWGAAAAGAGLWAGVGGAFGGGGAAAARPPLTKASCWLLKLYGRVYIGHVDARACRLELYRLYSDTILLQHLYELVTPKVQLSCVDNVLLVHYVDTAVVVLYDVALPGRTHVAGPLPLRRLRLVAAGNGAHTGGGGGGEATLLHQSLELHHAPSWRYHLPDVVFDSASQQLWRLQLDLTAIADSAGEPPALAGFLQRRRPPLPPSPLATDVRALLLGVCRAALQERLVLDSLRSIFDQLVGAYADLLTRAAHAGAAGGAGAAPLPSPGRGAGAALYGAPAAGGGAAAAAQRQAQRRQQSGSAGSGSAPAVTVLTPNEVAASLFKWAHDEEVVDALVLQAAISEYNAASIAAGLPPPPYLQLLALDALLQQGQTYQALQLLICQPAALAPLVTRRLVQPAAAAAAATAARPGADTGRGPDEGAAAAAVLPTGAVAPQVAVTTEELGREVMLRTAAAERVAAVAERVAAAAGAAGGGAGGGAAARPAAEAAVRQLLAAGQVLRAVKLARSCGILGGPAASAPLLLQAAARGGDWCAFAAIYRQLQGQLRSEFPTLEAAQKHYAAQASMLAAAG